MLRTKNINVNVHRPPVNIPLGRQGENLATCIIFDCSGFVQLYGDGTAELLHELKDGTIYPVAVTQDGASVSWIVTASDTATVGAGRAELRWYVGDTLAKSAKFRTSVSSALPDKNISTPPAPYQSWVDKVLKAAQEIKDGAISDEKLAAAIAAYLEEHPIDAGLDEAALAAYLVENGYLTDAALADAITQALAEAKASGQFDGAPGKDGTDGADGQPGTSGKSAYQYAQEGGYTGTEVEFAAKLAAEKFANPNALTFTGAVSATYDGSAPVSVEIPSGGGSGGGATDRSWKLIKTLNITTDVAEERFDMDDYGNSFSVQEILITGELPSYSGYIYIRPNDRSAGNDQIWPTANKPLKWFLSIKAGLLKTDIAISGNSIAGEYDKNERCPEYLTDLVVGASGGYTADGTLFVYGR